MLDFGTIPYYTAITLLIFATFDLIILMYKEFGIRNKANIGVETRDVTIILPLISVVIKIKRDKEIIVIKIIDSHNPFTQAGIKLSLKLKRDIKGRLYNKENL